MDSRYGCKRAIAWALFGALCGALCGACSEISGPDPEDASAPAPDAEDGGTAPDDGQAGAGAGAGGDGSAGTPASASSSHDPFLTVTHVVLDQGPQFACAYGFDRRAAQSDPHGAVTSALNNCQGEEGGWACTCNGAASTISYASTCVGALLETCGVEAEPIDGAAPLPRDCEANIPERAGHCERKDDGSFLCRCGVTSVTRTLMRDDPTCEQALWAACATDCGDTNGMCDPRVGDRAGAYRCVSFANGLNHDVDASGCLGALQIGVGLGSDYYETCNGYGGFCDRVGEDGLRCTCTDGSSHDTILDHSARHAPCRRALEATCGTGEPPADAFCTAQGNDHAARCVRPPADDAPLRCECVLQGVSFDTLLSDLELTGFRCEDALLTACPFTQPFTDDDHAAVCDHYASCDDTLIGFTEDACLASAPDACIACTTQALLGAVVGPDGCPEQLPQCYDACEDLVPVEDAVAACEAALEDRDLVTDSSLCMCERCNPAFGRCMADDGCVELLDCATSQGCDEATCQSDPICGPIVERYLSTRSLSLVLQVGSCEAREECAALAEP